MLVLSRGVGEEIQVGPDVTITVVRIVGGIARIGVTAPASCGIARTELLKKNQVPWTGSHQPDDDPGK